MKKFLVSMTIAMLAAPYTCWTLSDSNGHISKTSDDVAKNYDNTDIDLVHSIPSGTPRNEQQTANPNTDFTERLLISYLNAIAETRQNLGLSDEKKTDNTVPTNRVFGYAETSDVRFYPGYAAPNFVLKTLICENVSGEKELAKTNVSCLNNEQNLFKTIALRECFKRSSSGWLDSVWMDDYTHLLNLERDVRPCWDNSNNNRIVRYVTFATYFTQDLFDKIVARARKKMQWAKQAEDLLVQAHKHAQKGYKLDQSVTNIPPKK